jgi:predicted nucleic acid-binding protein
VVLVDTSIWIGVFRRRDPIQLDAAVDFDEVVTCLPVVQEVLQGFREEAAFRMAREAMVNLPILENPLQLPVYEDAIDLYRTARRQGITVRSSVDCLIAACALRNNCEVLHCDRDFDGLARVSRLRVRTV